MHTVIQYLLLVKRTVASVFSFFFFFRFDFDFVRSQSVVGVHDSLSNEWKTLSAELDTVHVIEMPRPWNVYQKKKKQIPGNQTFTIWSLKRRHTYFNCDTNILATAMASTSKPWLRETVNRT